MKEEYDIDSLNPRANPYAGKCGKTGPVAAAGWYVLLRTNETTGVVFCQNVKEIKKIMRCESVSSVPVEIPSAAGRRMRMIVNDVGMFENCPENRLATELYGELKEQVVGDVAVGLLNLAGNDICGFGSEQEAEQMERNIRNMYG